MSKEELEKEAYLYAKNSKDVQDFECGFDIAFKSYLASAEPREKRIAELEAQIEKMKCCENCAKNGHICVAEEMQGKLCGKNKDKWELRR